jgi:hypothetical protein
MHHKRRGWLASLIFGSVVAIAGLPAEAQTFQGILRCGGLAGPLGNGATDLLAVLLVFNGSDTANQVVRQVRLHDISGAVFFDTGEIALVIPPFGSANLGEFLPSTQTPFQATVRWTQEGFAPKARRLAGHLGFAVQDVNGNVQSTDNVACR